jgi:PAS domain S-box-containing protein
VILWHGIMLDITARKQVQERMELLESAIDLSSDAIYLIDENLRFNYVNASACRTLGYSREELLAMGPTGIDPDIDLDTARHVMNSSPLGTAVSFETRHRTRDGRTFPVELMGTHFERDGAKFSLSVVRDISERKQMELSLKKSEARYRRQFNQLQSVLESSSRVSVYALDRQYRYLFFNNRHRDGVKRSRGTDIAIGMNMLESMKDEAFREFCRQGFDRVLAGRVFFVESKEAVIRDGQQVYEFNDNYGSPIFNDAGEVVGLTVFAINTTERKQAEEKRNELQRQLQIIAENLPGAMSYYRMYPDGRGKMLYANKGLQDIFGFTLEELADDITPMTYRIHPDDIPTLTEQMGRAGREQCSCSTEFRVNHPEKGELWVLQFSTPMNESENSMLWYGLMFDITERKRMETRLREQKEFQDTLLNAINEVGLQMMLVENDRIVYVSNRKLAGELGYSDADIEAHPFLMDVIHPDDRERVANYQRSRMSGQGGPSYYELGLVTRDGGRREFETSIAQLPGTDPVRIITIGKEISERKRMQEMLRDSYRFLYNIIDTIVDPIFVKDRQHRWLHVNDAFCRFIGHSREKLIGKSDFDFFPECEARVFWAGDETVFTSGQEFSNEEEFTNSGGETRYIFTRKTLFTDASQQPLLVGIISDFTERKRMEDELHLREQKFRTLAENAPDNIVRYDMAGRIIYVNSVVERTFGVQAASLLGARVLDDTHEGRFDAYAKALDNVLASGESAELEMTLPNGADGVDGQKVHHIRMVAERNEAGDMTGVLAIGRDITELKRYEVARDAALAEAVRLAKARSEFLAHMSHELRTPLNGILGYTQILQRDKALNSRHVEALGVMRQSGEHLLALIEDILDLARIEAGRLTLDLGDISLSSFLCGVADIVSVKAQEKGIEFACDFSHDLPVSIRGDEKRLRQVLLNLLANAVKFTHQGRVVLHVSRVDVSHLAFVVEDTGVGIAADELESIFQPFEQSGHVQQQFGGSGLGLSICRQLMRLMGGNIWVESHLGVGSRFGFELELPMTTSVPSPPFAVSEAGVRSQQLGGLSSAGELDQRMVAPPAEELQALYRLAQLGNMRDILQYAQHLTGLDARYQPFAAQLQQMAQGYQSKAIHAFVSKYLQDAISE